MHQKQTHGAFVIYFQASKSQVYLQMVSFI